MFKIVGLGACARVFVVGLTGLGYSCFSRSRHTDLTQVNREEICEEEVFLHAFLTTTLTGLVRVWRSLVTIKGGNMFVVFPFFSSGGFLCFSVLLC